MENGVMVGGLVALKISIDVLCLEECKNSRTKAKRPSDHAMPYRHVRDHPKTNKHRETDNCYYIYVAKVEPRVAG